MGSTMKPTIFDERVAKALHSWHQNAKKHIKQNRQAGSGSPLPSRPSTPLHAMSPVHLLLSHGNKVESVSLSSRIPNAEGSASSSRRHENGQWCRSHHGNQDLPEGEESREKRSGPETHPSQHEIEMQSADFSFEKNSTILHDASGQ
ncbi:unnamed protein product [Ilex paraguariensis]